MLKWVLSEWSGDDEQVRVFESATAAENFGDHRWDMMTKSDRAHTEMYVGLANVDGDYYAELEDGSIDGDMWIVTKTWKNGSDPVAMPTTERFQMLLKMTGKKMTDISDQYGIPYKTLQKWVSGERELPKYVLEMLERLAYQERTDKERRTKS